MIEQRIDQMGEILMILVKSSIYLELFTRILTLLDRASISHYNKIKTIKFG